MVKMEGYMMIASLFVQGTILAGLALVLKLSCTTNLPLHGLVILYVVFAVSCLGMANWWRRVRVK